MKSVAVAYLLWFFLGGFGIHRVYLKRVGSGILMFILFIIGFLTMFILIGYIFILIWLIWWIIDAFLIIGWVDKINSTSEEYISAMQKNNYSALKDLHDLYEKGVITKEEYDSKRSKLI